MNIVDISIFHLITAYILLLLPVFILWFYKTGLTLSMLTSVARMTGQLIFIGIYLKYIFELNSSLLNISWAIAMMLITAVTIVSRSELKQRFFLLPIFIGAASGILFSTFFLLKFVLRLENLYEARYFIPITGMIAGNCLNAAIIGIRAFYNEIYKNEERYKFYLTCGAKPAEALRIYVKDAMKEAFNPAIAQMATIGLIALPGMMTGQILGGSSPVLAIKYQIMIMISIMTGNILTVHFSIYLSKKNAFDEMHMLKTEMFKEKRKKS